MEDRYLFKAKRIDNGEWVEGQYVNTCYPKDCKKTGHFIVKYPNHLNEIYTSTICQCTGLKDKNGKLIWENDIMVAHLDYAYPENETYIRILWYESGFCSKEKGSEDISPIDKFDKEHFEVCGNIFDNPELLESEG